MGYSIMTPFKTVKDRDKMFDFISKNFISVSNLLSMKYEDKYTSGPCTNEDISYTPNGRIPVIGFNYNGSEFGREYAFQLCYLMAFLFGKEKHIKHLNLSLKYVLYDGDEPMYLVKEGETVNNLDCISIDDTGFHKFNRRMYCYIENSEINKVENKFQEEVIRLKLLWKKHYQN